MDPIGGVFFPSRSGKAIPIGEGSDEKVVRQMRLPALPPQTGKHSCGDAKSVSKPTAPSPLHPLSLSTARSLDLATTPTFPSTVDRAPSSLLLHPFPPSLLLLGVTCLCSPSPSREPPFCWGRRKPTPRFDVNKRGKKERKREEKGGRRGGSWGGLRKGEVVFLFPIRGGIFPSLGIPSSQHHQPHQTWYSPIPSNQTTPTLL
ncbi:hypothetical protein IE53DRAFT_201858 [Violaceomyces palustris]|uniref:Uncharacterized protein n=1 Tax=Violaceomyces palustris TaxID=1673888 RepID=A0ACD0NRA7_9BASI|nr:hypothetical protein IE53DRAFT_201858 [Violaceomyces palustris]